MTLAGHQLDEQGRLADSPLARVGCVSVRTRVTDVAIRWGFYHQSRFAQQYREQLHELPSVTLHR